MYAPSTLAKNALGELPPTGYTIMTRAGKVLDGGDDLIDCLQRMRERSGQAVKLVRNSDHVMLAFTTGSQGKREGREPA